MKLIIVNENDEVIGSRERDDRNQSDIIRVSGAWILNEKQEALVAQRAFSKHFSPGLWTVSAAGTVEEGESYAENICKEIGEELGIAVTENQLITGSRRLSETRHRYFCQMYFVRLDITPEFFIQREEVESAKWMSVLELAAWFEQSPSDFTSNFALYLSDLQEFVGE